MVLQYIACIINIWEEEVSDWYRILNLDILFLLYLKAFKFPYQIKKNELD